VHAAADVESIERATLAAVSPRVVEPLEGWLLAMEAGTIGRAKSAVPLRHEAADPAILARIESRYAARDLRTILRVADASCFEPLHAEMRGRGYRPTQPTLVQIASAAQVAGAESDAGVAVACAPSEHWASVYTGEGFDAADGANRVKAFSRAPDAVYASIDEAGETLAVGIAAFGFGWASVHGMRTARAQRGRGLARRVLGALASAALRRGVDAIFLQVEEANAAARALYEGAGFAPAWRYAYWMREE